MTSEKALQQQDSHPVENYPQVMFCGYCKSGTTICAQQHKFKTLNFSQEEIFEIAEDWNYHYLATQNTKKPIVFVKYEDFIIQPQKVINDISKAINLPLKKRLLF